MSLTPRGVSFAHQAGHVLDQLKNLAQSTGSRIRGRFQDGSLDGSSFCFDYREDVGSGRCYRTVATWVPVSRPLITSSGNGSSGNGSYVGHVDEDWSQS